MKLIKPSQISGEIMTLIEEADDTLILVSPYYKLSGWNKFSKAIDYISKKDIRVEFYVRENQPEDFQEVQRLGFEPNEIKNLHTKLYINEKYAIVSSMNLHKYSDENSLDIALKTETEKEYNEIWNYYERYLASHVTDSTEDWTESLSFDISNKTNKKFRCYIDESTLIIQGPNRYHAHISNDNKRNALNIVGILSQEQKERMETEINSFERKIKLKLNLYEPGSNGWGYNTVWHHSNIPLKSLDINNLSIIDITTIQEMLLSFIIGVEDFKGSW